MTQDFGMPLKMGPRRLLIRFCFLFSGAFFLLILFVYYGPGFSRKLEPYTGPCTIEAANSIPMEQDDPCILKLIQLNYLFPPSQKELNLENPELLNPSMGQAQVVLDVLNQKTNGFFVECGALDGEIRSNTLFMEQSLNWQGILIEGDPDNYKKMEEKHRRAWTVPACLSPTNSPKKVTFKQNFNEGRISQNEVVDRDSFNSVQVQCFPIYSILAALNRTTVDYFSLDIEGDELAVLKTIPWDKVNIQTLSVEFIHDKEGKEQIRKYMWKRGYEMVKEVTDKNWLANDFIFNRI